MPEEPAELIGYCDQLCVVGDQAESYDPVCQFRVVLHLSRSSAIELDQLLDLGADCGAEVLLDDAVEGLRLEEGWQEAVFEPDELFMLLHGLEEDYKITERGRRWV